MRRRSAVRLGALVALLLCAALLGGASAAATPRSMLVVAPKVTPAGVWGKAEEVPGTAVTQRRRQACRVDSLSCSSCRQLQRRRVLRRRLGPTRPSSSTRRAAAWGKAEEVPGTAALNAGGDAEVYSLSCSSSRQLQRRRVLQGRLGPQPGLRRQRDGRRLGQGRGGAGHGFTQRRRGCRGLLSLLQLCRQLRRRRVLPRRLEP